jgi:ribosomal protein L12E/L44/L45/RPP1/RPP2
LAQEVVKGAGSEMFKGLSTDAMANDAIKQIADKIAAGALTDRDLTFLDSTKQFVAAQINDQGYQTAPKELWDHYNVLDAMVRKAVELPRLQESRARYIDAQDTVRHWALKESLGRPRGGVRLTEAGVNRVFELVAQQVLTEGIMDTLKGAAGAVTGAIKQTGKNLTTKITADKLKKAWEFEGGNTDSEAIKVFLKNQGVTPEIIDGAMKTVGIQAPAAPAAAAADPATPAATTATTTPAATTKTLTKPATTATTATTTPAAKTATPAAKTATPAAPANYGTNFGTKATVTQKLPVPTAKA